MSHIERASISASYDNLSFEQPDNSEYTNLLQRLGKYAGRISLVVAMTAGCLMGEAGVDAAWHIEHAAMATEDTGGYPWADAEHISQPPAQDNLTWGYQNKEVCDSKSEKYDCGAFTLSPTTWHIRDQWGYDLRNCTSYVAWKIEEEFSVNISNWGNADQWDDNARRAGYAVDDSPEPGDIAVWDSTHVALVADVLRDGRVRVLEYNQGFNGKFRSDRVTRADHYIDINGNGVVWDGGSSEAGSPEVQNGDFVASNETHNMYRIVGGAPVYIPNQGAIPDYNGNIKRLPQSAIDAMRPYPEDGTVVSIAETGGAGVYRFVGGAPIRLYNWGAIPGCCGQVVSINFESLNRNDHMRTRPVDGSVISIAEAGGGGIYEFVGGAPIRQFNWGAIPGFGRAVDVNAESLANLDHMNAVPADGATVSLVEAGGSGIYRFVGGAPIRLYNWGAIADCCGTVVNINAQSLGELDHMNMYPSDHSVISIAEAAVRAFTNSLAVHRYSFATGGRFQGYIMR